ncbi:autophagy protein atg9 [Tulasnella sp. 331]|nr:autophagy protein atg9 [Tulasnella sp. 331]
MSLEESEALARSSRIGGSRSQMGASIGSSRPFLNLLNPMGRHYKGYQQMTGEPVEEEDEDADEDEDPHRAARSNSASSPGRNKRVFWQDGQQHETLELHDRDHHPHPTPNAADEQVTEPEEEEDAVPQSFLIEAAPRKSSAASTSQSRREERRAARLLRKSNRHQSSTAPGAQPQLSKPPRPSELEGPAVMAAGSSDTTTAFASTRPQKGLDDYQKALWNWVYAYYVGKGIYCIALSRGLNLLTVGFVIAFSTFLLGCVDYSLVHQDGTGRLADLIVPRCVSRFSGFTFLFFLCFGLFYVIQVVSFVREILRLVDMYKFYTYLLDIPDPDLQTISWPEIVRRIGQIRDQNPGTAISSNANALDASAMHHSNSPPTASLDAHDIANRIMRQENYLIALFNKEVLDLRVPLPAFVERLVGDRDFSRGNTLTRALEWNLRYCLLGHLFDHNGRVRKAFLKDKQRGREVELLRARFIFMGILNAIFVPFIVLYLLMYSFFRYFEEYHKNPSSIGGRQYTPYAEWKFREFNELPHIFRRRLNESYPVAGEYIDQFPKEKTALVMRFVAFVAGSFASVLAVATLLDPDIFLHFEVTPHRTVLFYLGLFGSVLAVARGMVPDSHRVFDPELLMREVISHTHYMPAEWKAQLHSQKVHTDFGGLFEMKITIFAQELISVVLTPFVLWYSLPPCAPAIVDFFREFTVHVDGLGYVCTFAVFDFKRHGNVNFGAPTEINDERMMSREGKMEKSFLNFKAANPEWNPIDPSGSVYLNRLADIYQQRDTSAHAQALITARLRQQRSRSGRALYGQPSAGYLSGPKPFVHPNDTPHSQAPGSGMSLHEARLAEKAATYERALQRSISASLARKRSTGAQPGASEPVAVERTTSFQEGPGMSVMSEQGDDMQSQDGGHPPGAEIQSELGDSYVHGVRTRGLREEDYLEEEEELDGGGVIGLLTQIYRRCAANFLLGLRNVLTSMSPLEYPGQPPSDVPFLEYRLTRCLFFLDILLVIFLLPPSTGTRGAYQLRLFPGMKVICEAAYMPSILKRIIDEYPAGSAILRELLQNSDDSGAQSQEFILDTRTFSTTRLFDPGLGSCQGPALLAVNNSHFLEKDWVAITTVMDSSKKSDETSTGKYGLGFRSCYHVTDNPHIFSGKNLLILDPHRRIPSAPGGLSLDGEDSRDRAFLDHFSTFQSILPDHATIYNGTAIRLPLRLAAQAETSDIKNSPTSIASVRTMFDDFVNQELPVAMLFLKNITSISLFEVGDDGIKQPIGKGWIEHPETVVGYRNRNRGREKETSCYELTIQLEVGETSRKQSWLLTQFVEDYDLAKTIMSNRTGREVHDVGDAIVADKLLPHVALALPLPEVGADSPPAYLQRGRLFTLLPLPIFTGFPAHLHSVLALTSSRQNLRNTIDVTGGSREEFLVQWNRAIFEDFAPKAWAAMLLRMAEKALNPLDAWPNVSPASDRADQEYWKALPAALLRQAGPKPIWPTSRSDGTAQYLQLARLLVAKSNAEPEVVEILARCAVLIVRPAPAVCTLIQGSADYGARMLTPKTAHIGLKVNAGLVGNLDGDAVRSLGHYLASASDINLIFGIRLIPNVGGGYTSLDPHNKYKLFERAAVDPVGVDDALLQIFRDLCVPVLHPNVKSRGPIIRAMLHPVSDMGYFFHRLDASTTANLTQVARTRLHEHLSIHFGVRGQALKPGEVTILRLLPVFPVLPPGVREVGRFSYESDSTSSVVIDDSVQVVPNIKDVHFVCAKECWPLFSAIRKTFPGECKASGEAHVLGLAIRKWSQQGQVPGLPELLVDRIFHRLRDLSADDLQLLRRLPIIDVGSEHPKRSPFEVVDPDSGIAELFDPGDAVLPQGLFNQSIPGSYLTQLRSEDMLQRILSVKIAKERVNRIVDCDTPPQQKDVKGLNLLRLLDDLYQSKEVLEESLVECINSQPWLPAVGQFFFPSQCWDRRPSDRYLCDRILPLVEINLRSRSLRRALGWETLSFDILKKQLLAVVSNDGPAEDDMIRINALIQRLSDMHDFDPKACSKDDLKSLTHTLCSKSWVPISGTVCIPSHRAVLMDTEVNLRFYQVSLQLITDPKVRRFFAVMGVLDRPSIEALYEENISIASELHQADLEHGAKTRLISSAISVLTALHHRETGSKLDRSRLYVPTKEMTLEKFDSIIFDDGSDTSGEIPSGYKIAHPDISPALARQLGLMRLSDDRFAQDEDELESFQIGEALPTRIKGVLKDYDKEYASNEWVANADDANAKEVAFVIDEAIIESGNLLGPHLAEFQRSPALVIHNDQAFSDKDFDGLGNIGQGGKRDSPESIGRFGLGAFSFYHFTEMPMVVSAGSVLFLDPSQSYLPRERTGGKRTGVKIPLNLCQIKYPGHLKALDGLFNFSTSVQHYNGTLFRLPLRTPQQAKESKLSDSSFSVLDIARLMNKFFHLSTQSLFFSRICRISASRRGADLGLTPMWSVTAIRKESEATQDSRMKNSTVHLSITPEEPLAARKERWFIAWERRRVSDIPKGLQSLISPHRLSSPAAAIALQLSPLSNEPTTTELRESRLFATLPLPIPISLPVHIHGTWILSRDRRALRFDAPDARGERPLDTKFNEFLLEKLVAPLYLSVIAKVASRYTALYETSWPKNPSDAISRTLYDALYAQFVTTEESVCITATEEILAPSQVIFHTSVARSPQAVLNALNMPGYVDKLPFEKSAVEWDRLKVDDAAMVANLLRARGPAVKQAFSGPLAEAHLDGIIQFLIKGEVDLEGLALLQLGNGTVVEFHKSLAQTVFASSRSTIAELFGENRVLGTAIKQETIDLLLGLGINVALFDADSLRSLVAEREPSITPSLQRNISAEERVWLTTLLNILSSDPVVTLKDVEDLPLIPSSNADLAVSLVMLEARANVISLSSLGNDLAILLPLIGLRVIVVEQLPGVPFKPAVFDLSHFLDAIASLDLQPMRQTPAMTGHSWYPLMEWVRHQLQTTRIINTLNPAQSDSLAELPLFEGREGGADRITALCSASGVMMLPPGVDLAPIARYLPGGTIFCPFTLALSGVLQTRPNQCLNHEGLLNRFRFPVALSDTEIADFHRLLGIVTMHHAGGFQKAIVPDLDLVLRPARDIYDHREPLFNAVFAERPQALVHPAFRMHMDGLVGLGVHRGIRIQELKACAILLDQDGREGRPVRGRAEVYWEHFRDSDLTRRINYEEISTLRFIPTAFQRHLYLPEFGSFAQPLPDVVAPTEITSEEHLPILWTQRARFMDAPPDFLHAVMPNLGLPSAAEVVQHLEILVNRVAPAHPSNRNLLSDLTATYNWLNTNIEEAEDDLRRLSSIALWLNVEDGVQDGWVWRKAGELVFDLRYDDEAGRHYDVNTFLLPFKHLLLASGAHEHRHLALPDAKLSEDLTHRERLHRGLDELRSADCLTDIEFNVNGETIKAHRAILAAVVPHFMTVFRGEFREAKVAASVTEPMIYELHATASAFAVRSVVDYVYSGSFRPPPCSTTEEAGPALADLLDLMDLANLWDMEELKRNAEEAIVELRLVRLETCAEISIRAAACQALRLVEVCKKTREVNDWSTS